MQYSFNTNIANLHALDNELYRTSVEAIYHPEAGEKLDGLLIACKMLGVPFTENGKTFHIDMGEIRKHECKDMFTLMRENWRED